MSDFLTRDKDLLASIASIVAIISFIFVFLASLASRKANIIRTAPLIIPELGRNGRLQVRNLNGRLAYDVKAEPFHMTFLENDPFFPKGTYVFRAYLSGAGFISSNPDSRLLTLAMDGEEQNDNFMHYLWTRWISRTSGITFFFKDAQNNRLAARFISLHDDTSDDFKIIYASKYIPSYRLGFWIIYGIRSINTHLAKLYKPLFYETTKFIKKILQELKRGGGGRE